MAVIRLKRGTSVPTTSNLTNLGELAFNYSKNELYIRGNSEVVKVGGDMERLYYFEGNTSSHSFIYPFDKDYIYKVHVIASTRTSSVDSSATQINYLNSSSSLFSGSYLSFTVTDNNISTITSYKNTSSFYVNDSFSNTVTPSYATTKVIDFEISPTFESGVASVYQWVAYGTSICSVSDQANAPITLAHFAHSIDGTLGGLTINPGLDIGTYSPYAVSLYRIKRR